MCKCLIHFFHLFYKTSGFSFFSKHIYWNIVILSGESFFSFCFVVPVRGVCLLCIRFIFNWVCWVRGNFSGEPGHVYVSCVCLRLWSAGPVRVYLGTVVVWTAGLYGFSSLWLCSGGYSTGEMVRGGWFVFPFAFSSLLSVLLAVGLLR